MRTPFTLYKLSIVINIIKGPGTYYFGDKDTNFFYSVMDKRIEFLFHTLYLGKPGRYEYLKCILILSDS